MHRAGVRLAAEAAERTVEATVAETDGYARVGADRQGAGCRDMRHGRLVLGIAHHLRKRAVGDQPATALVDRARHSGSDRHEVGGGADEAEHPAVTDELGHEGNLHAERLAHRAQQFRNDVVEGSGCVDAGVVRQEHVGLPDWTAARQGLDRKARICGNGRYTSTSGRGEPAVRSQHVADVRHVDRAAFQGAGASFIDRPLAHQDAHAARVQQARRLVL